jgi:hypothetical protein
MATREPAPTYREVVTYDSTRQKWLFDPHWLRWLNSLQTQVGDTASLPSGHTIEGNGTAATQRHILDFVGDGVTVTDDSTRTVVSIEGGFFTKVILQSDVSTAATTDPINLGELSWLVEPNTTYAFRWVGNVHPSTSTTGVGFQLKLT